MESSIAVFLWRRPACERLPTFRGVRFCWRVGLPRAWKMRREWCGGTLMLEALGVSYFIDLTKQIDLLRSPGNPPFACALLCRSLCLLGFAVLPASRACSLCLGRGGLHQKVSLLLRYTYRWRPYRAECAGSRPTSEVKRRRARLVLGWGLPGNTP